MTMCGDESGVGLGVGVAVGDGLGVGVAVGVGVGESRTVLDSAMVTAWAELESELVLAWGSVLALFRRELPTLYYSATPSAVTINVHVPAPRNSAGTST